MLYSSYKNPIRSTKSIRIHLTLKGFVFFDDNTNTCTQQKERGKEKEEEEKNSIQNCLFH
jgi:hypothetical protein